MRSRTTAVALTVSVLLSVLALAGVAGAEEPPPDDLPFTVQPGVEQVTVIGAPRQRYDLVRLDGDEPEALLGLISDELGQATFAYVPDEFDVRDTESGVLGTIEGATVQPGTYRIDEVVGDEVVSSSEPFEVLAVDDVPDQSFYDAEAAEFAAAHPNGGFGYITMRDGVQLSVMVRFPDPAIAALWGHEEGEPYPTVVEYSGYSPSNPFGSGEPGSMIANLFGFASVGINIRGTGCSGGVFDVFNAAQRADGYDAIEIIARQPWVKDNQVGMVGLSYSGILQLYAASTRPPSLAAITPLSTIEDPWDQQWPGGVYNSGFTKEWLAERDRQSGQAGGWVKTLIDNGDATCAANQQIRRQNLDFEEFGASLVTRPADADARNLSRLVREIDVPVYQSGGWQDEQTGSQFADLLDDYVNAPVTKFRVYNGRHPDGYTPINLSRWYEHLAFFVKKEIPAIPPLIRAAAPVLMEEQFGVAGLEFEPDRWTDRPSYEAALQDYADSPDVDLLWDFGAGREDVPGAPVPRGSTQFDSWPPPSTEWRQYFGPDGTLVDEPPAHEDVQRYRFDEEGTGVAYADASGSDFIKPQIDANWEPMVEGDGLSFVSEPLDEMKTIAGDGYVDLWFRSEGTDAAIEVVLSEVYPDGQEVIVQHGLARASFPELDPTDSTGTKRRHLFYAQDQKELAPGEVRNIQVPIYPVAHPFREGSRVRLSVNTPGRDDPIWAYVTDSYGATFQEVSFGGDTPSSVVLPLVDPAVVAGDIVETPPPCNSLRGQVCREYVPVRNTQGCASTRFADLPYTNPFCVDISALAASGVTGGYPDGTFRPQASITRGEMVAFLYRHAGAPEGDDPQCTTAPFPDVPADHVFCGVIAWAAGTGVTKGAEDGTFRPNAPVARQAMAAFLVRLDQL